MKTVASTPVDDQAMGILVDRLQRRAAASLDHPWPCARGVSANPQLDRRLAVVFQRAEPAAIGKQAGDVDGFAGGEGDAGRLAMKDEDRRRRWHVERLAIREFPPPAQDAVG